MGPRELSGILRRSQKLSKALGSFQGLSIALRRSWEPIWLFFNFQVISKARKSFKELSEVFVDSQELSRIQAPKSSQQIFGRLVSSQFP